VFNIYVKKIRNLFEILFEKTRRPCTLGLGALIFKFVLLSLAMGEDMEYILPAEDVAQSCAHKQI
jgi:hypothetical protein